MPHRHGMRRLLGAAVVGTIVGSSFVATSAVALAETTDTLAPAPTALSVEPSTVDASRDAVPVVVTVRLQDALSGAAHATISLGQSSPAVDLAPLSGTAQDGLWSGIASVPAGTPAGPVATDLTVTDAAGNSTSSGVSAVQAAEGPAPVAVSSAVTVPGAPLVGAVSAGDASATLSWQAPTSDGGQAPYAYVITAAPSARRYVLPGSARVATVGRLTNGSATTFQVAALNGAGTGPSSTATAAVTPRLPGTLVVLAQPATTVVYGTASAVQVDLRTAHDVSVSGRPVELLARIGAARTWARVATATSDATGRVVLRAVLPASSALKVRHLDDVVHTAEVAVRSVFVRTRVSAVPRASRLRQGATVSIHGSIAPAHPVGSVVRLQRHTTNGWLNVTDGRMTTTTSYAVSWKPTAVGTYPLRVVKLPDADHLAGLSPVWLERIDPEIAIDVARAIRANSRITLAEVHEGGVRDLATPKLVVADLAMGRLAHRSSYGNAPGGYTTVDLRLLKALRRMGQLGTVTVSEISGGSHAGNSAHYYGRGIDITWVNGAHVGRGGSYRMAVDTCRAYGASQVFSPSYDPYGGHGNHVHCGWG